MYKEYLSWYKHWEAAHLRAAPLSFCNSVAPTFGRSGKLIIVFLNM